MSYVFDTGPFIELNRLPRDVFPGPWEAIEAALNDGTILSCREVYNEINDRTGALKSWASTYKEEVFTRPDLEEQAFVGEVLERFPLLLKKAAIEEGRQDADPFVIARGNLLGYTVVTTERFKPNAEKIPNACKHFGIECCDLYEFYRRVGIQFRIA